MKKITLASLIALIMFAIIPAQVIAGNEKQAISTTATTTTESAEVNVLLSRLNEIKAMDVKTLNSSEKKQLRKEVRAIKSDLKERAEGVYLSVAAILIIILLLVLLL